MDAKISDAKVKGLSTLGVAFVCYTSQTQITNWQEARQQSRLRETSLIFSG
jgi:hypothetical protein